jgi:integrating conjugative element membrane protein (TIGR03747 family)
MSTQAPARSSKVPSARPVSASASIAPISLAIKGACGFLMASIFGWTLGVVVEVVGVYFLWPEQGLSHSQNVLTQNLEYIAQAPTSLVVDDTLGFVQAVMGAIELPFKKMGILSTQEQAAPKNHGLGALAGVFMAHAKRLLVLCMLVAQDTALRLAVVLFALPGFVLACLLGAVDGLVRRDVRRFCGGREKTGFHRLSKHSFFWTTTVGFVLYLICPLGGLNPAYLVLGLSVFSAMSLSNALASYKKYF